MTGKACHPSTRRLWPLCRCPSWLSIFCVVANTAVFTLGYGFCNMEVLQLWLQVWDATDVYNIHPCASNIPCAGLPGDRRSCNGQSYWLSRAVDQLCVLHVCMCCIVATVPPWQEVFERVLTMISFGCAGRRHCAAAAHPADPARRVPQRALEGCRGQGSCPPTPLLHACPPATVILPLHAMHTVPPFDSEPRQGVSARLGMLVVLQCGTMADSLVVQCCRLTWRPCACGTPS